MGFSSLFIRRPVLAIVLNIMIVLFGAVGISMLGVRDYPVVDPPVITVSTSYPGANASIIESKITEPLELSINGIGGIRTLTSSSADGQSNINVEFNLGADLDAAASDVRDRVSRAMRNLPADINNPVIAKADANASPILFVTVQSDRLNRIQLTDYATDVLKERLQTIPEVSEVRIWGEQRYAIRLWMDPGRMVSRGITATDVRAALDRENIELPAGRIEGNTTEMTLQAMSGMHTVQEFNDLIIRVVNGTPVRFRDIGEAREGAEDERTIMKWNGVPMVGVALVPQPGANHIAIADEFYKRLVVLKKQLPPTVKIEQGYDLTVSIRKSIEEVLFTIFLSFFLVVGVIFLFFRNLRATIIPMLAMPISLIGAFFIMQVCGFSINVLTLLALVLATGLVVDDAIVVLENIYRKIEQGEPPVEAGHHGSKEIFFAIISTTITLAAVLLPIMFMQGLSGRLFREFGAVVAGSVLLSAFVSLSLTPMMCTRFLHRHEPDPRSLYMRTEHIFERIINGYRVSLDRFLTRRRYSVVIILCAIGVSVGIYLILPRELAPVEDRSRLSLNATTPEGSSYEFTCTYVDSLNALVDRTIPERIGVMMRVPGMGANAINSGAIQITLRDPTERKRSQQQIFNQLSQQVRQLSDARAVVIQEPTIGNRRGGLPVQFVLQAPSIDALREKLPLFLKEAGADSCFQSVDYNMKFNKPEVRLTIDRDKARELGIAAVDVAQALQLTLGGVRYDYFSRNGKQYSVIGQYFRKDRGSPADISATYVKNAAGQLIQLDNLISMTESSSPPQLNRFDRAISATVSAGLVPGRTIGDGIKAMQRIADRVLDKSFTTALTGQSRDFVESSSGLLWAFLFALVLVYLILSAQFESFRDSLTIMLSVPLALAGAVFSLWYLNQSLNIFSQIGMIMLIGIVTKNGILIVEFANQRRDRGMSIGDAVRDAAVSRFRPIVMTSMTVMLGSLPIALAIGGGAESRMSMGIVVIGGMLFALALSLYVVPAVYLMLAGKRAVRHDQAA
jgi:multidrug efflux pump